MKFSTYSELCWFLGILTGIFAVKYPLVPFVVTVLLSMLFLVGIAWLYVKTK